MGHKSDACFLFYKFKFVHLFNKQFAMTYQFKAFKYNTVEIMYFSYAHFKDIEVVLGSTSYQIPQTYLVFSDTFLYWYALMRCLSCNNHWAISYERFAKNLL